MIYTLLLIDINNFLFMHNKYKILTEKILHVKSWIFCQFRQQFMNIRGER